MKKLIPILASVILVSTFCGFSVATKSADDAQEPSTDYIILRYTAYGYGGKNQVIVHYGGTKMEKLEIPKETLKEYGTTNFVIDLLNQFNAKGYTLVSTANSTLAEVSEITCFLKKTR